ncbi:hypothetical protein F4553_006052 [Allocatelliglobosispora scoriae]|uniref:Peptidase S8/S53 domain-containing protein n=1 Tax=Allocatelliglobosispora scoriae TaxID=643052 RepID=A0A841BYQ4_9ACTN|nr:S8 family serine peptidase [Allocatelliglobosispora scoriae]MBB5872618.1 hypothetical protein [Allocatelliglobosispora scoriae]
MADNKADTQWYSLEEPFDAEWTAPRLDIDTLGLIKLGVKMIPSADGTPALYRRDCLLADGEAVRAAPQAIDEINACLAQRGWHVEIPADAIEADLVPLYLSGDGHTPVDPLDARKLLALADGLSDSTVVVVASLVLDRLLFVGTPAKDGFSVSGVFAGAARQAVAVIGGPPARRPIDALPGGRRPVVAVLDSGVGPHPWLDGDGPDPFWTDAADLGWVPKAPARALVDPVTGNDDPHDGVIDSHAGHGTFIAGLIRQAAPDARVLSMRLMRGAGMLEEHLVISALEWLLSRCRAAATDPSLFVDVINLSFGYYAEAPTNSVRTARLRYYLGELGDLGVRVVAAAGNHANQSIVYPAVFADQQFSGKAPKTQMVSVGALNPDGSQAAYSNYGRWVQHTQVGTALISTMPVFGRAPASDGATPYEPNHLTSGFARWSGTSFATGVLSGLIAAALTDDPTLHLIEPEIAHERARRALDAADGR